MSIGQSAASSTARNGFPPSTSVRSLFDDVDDFHGWAASPPKDPDGTVRPGFANWKRRVLVQRVHANNPAMPMGSETGVKWVIVIVERDGVEVCRLHAHRADIDPG